jgi:hypothetical protein
MSVKIRQSGKYLKTEKVYYSQMVEFAQIVTQSNTKTVFPAIEKLGVRTFRNEFKRYAGSLN